MTYLYCSGFPIEILLAVFAMLTLRMGRTPQRHPEEGFNGKLRVRATIDCPPIGDQAGDFSRAGATAKGQRRLNLADSIRRHLAPVGGIELTLKPREPVRHRPKLAK